MESAIVVQANATGQSDLVVQSIQGRTVYAKKVQTHAQALSNRFQSDLTEPNRKPRQSKQSFRVSNLQYSHNQLQHQRSAVSSKVVFGWGGARCYFSFRCILDFYKTEVSMNPLDCF